MSRCSGEADYLLVRKVSMWCVCVCMCMCIHTRVCVCSVFVVCVLGSFGVRRVLGELSPSSESLLLCSPSWFFKLCPSPSSCPSTFSQFSLSSSSLVVQKWKAGSVNLLRGPSGVSWTLFLMALGWKMSEKIYAKHKRKDQIDAW